MVTETYVYDGVEVEPTGRIASRTVELTSKKYVDTLIEIKPVDNSGPTWKRWVKQLELYKIS
jgi:hypothetical protein